MGEWELVIVCMWEIVLHSCSEEKSNANKTSDLPLFGTCLQLKSECVCDYQDGNRVMVSVWVWSGHNQEQDQVRG